MKHSTRIVPLMAVLACALAGIATAQQKAAAAKPEPTEAQLKAKAKVTEAVATRTALAAVDAVSGKVISHEHEDDEDEAKEEKEEASKKAPGISAQTPHYHVTKRIVVGGEGGWDYLTVDTVYNRLFLSRGTHVMVVDLNRDSLIADIPDTPGVHGVAFAYDAGRGFTTNGRDTTATIFDLKTLAVTGTVKVTGRNPDAIMYEPVSGRIFTFNGVGFNTTAIDAATGKVAGTIDLGGKPEAAVWVGDGRVYVNVEDRGEIVRFDARTLAVEARWSIKPCEDPTGLAFDRAHQRLFASCGNRMMAIVDAKTGRVVATPAIGAGADGAAFDPATQLAFATNGQDGTLTVIHEDSPDKYTVVGHAATERGARTIALDERTHRVYTVTAEYGAMPDSTKENPRPRRPVIAGTFRVLVLER